MFAPSFKPHWEVPLLTAGSFVSLIGVRLKLAVSDGCRRKSGRGLPHSKTWRNFLRSGRAQSVLIGGQPSTVTGSFSRTPLIRNNAVEGVPAATETQRLCEFNSR